MGDKPLIFGSMWGEVNATFFRSVGVVGCIVDGGVRDLDEMTGAGLHAMSRGVCIGHAFGGIPVTWDVPIQAFGVTVRPGQLIHADKHGFLVVPEEDEQELLEASEFMDNLERKCTIVPGKEGTGKCPLEISKAMNEANKAFAEAKNKRYGTYEERFGSGDVKKLCAARLQRFSMFRPSEGSVSKAPPLGVFGQGALLDTVALQMHNRTSRSLMGLLVGSAKMSNSPASSHYFGFNLNFNDVPYGNANALHIHGTFEYFMAFSGDFEIRAGHNARSVVTLNKFDTCIVPAFVKRYFKCIATREQMHYCEEMKEYSDGQCALILAGIVGPPSVQWSQETVSKARDKKVLCTNGGIMYDETLDEPEVLL